MNYRVKNMLILCPKPFFQTGMVYFLSTIYQGFIAFLVNKIMTDLEREKDGNAKGFMEF
jgi:hypothetical protein